MKTINLSNPLSHYVLVVAAITMWVVLLSVALSLLLSSCSAPIITPVRSYNSYTVEELCSTAYSKEIIDLTKKVMPSPLDLKKPLKAAKDTYMKCLTIPKK